MSYSIRCSQFVDQELVHQLFSSALTVLLCKDNKNNFNNTYNSSISDLVELRLQDYENLDPILLLILSACQLSELENRMFAMNMLHLLSPQVAATLMWFFKGMTDIF